MIHKLFALLPNINIKKAFIIVPIYYIKNYLYHICQLLWFECVPQNSCACNLIVNATVSAGGAQGIRSWISVHKSMLVIKVNSAPLDLLLLSFLVLPPYTKGWHSTKTLSIFQRYTVGLPSPQNYEPNTLPLFINYVVSGRTATQNGLRTSL